MQLAEPNGEFEGGQNEETSQINLYSVRARKGYKLDLIQKQCNYGNETHEIHRIVINT